MSPRNYWGQLQPQRAEMDTPPPVPGALPGTAGKTTARAAWRAAKDLKGEAPTVEPAVRSCPAETRLLDQGLESHAQGFYRR